MALSLPAINSIAEKPKGTLKCFESIIFTALRDSMIQPGSGDVRSCCLGGRRIPLEELISRWGTSSKLPFLTKLAARKNSTRDEVMKFVRFLRQES